jgi:23S rRNA (cytidine1920-2'-O)/16S rRNA (cytidine1409-2'-O)-methyltransferase
MRAGLVAQFRRGCAPRPGAVSPVPLVAMARQRVDSLLAERGLAGSRTSAAKSVRAGRVRLGPDGPLAVKPGQMVTDDTELLLEQAPAYVSRGGVKLQNALDAFGVDPAGSACIDVGASTGGFTDCLLQRGAARVIALDVGRGQLDWGLRNDDRVHVLERVNARELEQLDLPFEPSLATIDVSFISLALVLPAVAARLHPPGDVVALVKPQFELGRERVGKGGVVRSAADRRDALLNAAEAADSAGLNLRGFASSGLPGPKGNRETFMWAATDGPGVHPMDAALAAEPEER